MSDGGDCRTAPATPGLLKIVYNLLTQFTEILFLTPFFYLKMRPQTLKAVIHGSEMSPSWL